ncbi:MAG: ABC transporter permease [Planctomycetota bacterium]|nr:ABC transporter permease [Planctomycetota bacterium]
MFSLLRSLAGNKRLLIDFVKRDLKARYVGSSMGFFWSVIFPIVNLFVFMFVFRLLLNARWGDDAGPKETALIMLAGILVWAGFAETLSRATNCLIENANLIQKVVFPSEILPVYLTTSSIVNMLIGLPIVVLGCWIFGITGPGMSVVMVPVLLILQMLFTIGLGYFLTTLNLFLRDTYHLVGVGVQVWMFATPIFYPGEMVRNARIMLPDWLSYFSNMPLRIDKETGLEIPLSVGEGGDLGLGWMLDINPMHWLIDAWREVLIFGRWPDLSSLAMLAVVSVAVFAIGATFFRSQQAKFPDLL